MEPPDGQPPSRQPSAEEAREKEARREAREQMARALEKFTGEGRAPGWWRFIKGRDIGRIVLLALALIGVVFGARHCGQNASRLIEQLDQDMGKQPPANESPRPAPPTSGQPPG